MITLSLTHRESYILEAMLRVAVETTANENLTAFNSTLAAVADRIAEARRGEHTTSVTNKG
jgi:hypothetical protein